MKTLPIELRAKVLGLYLGCQVLDDQEVIRELRSVHNHGFCTLSYNDIGEQEDVNIDDLQLILTPLSEITDEDAIEIVKIEYGDNMVHENPRKSLISSGRGVAIRANDADYVNLRVADYLRSKSYHLPYMGYDLYESGIAIKPLND